MENKLNKRVALFVSTLCSFITPFMGASVNVALPSIGKEFGMDAILLNWVTTAYLLSAAIFLVPFGRIADIYGRKRIFSYGVLIYSIASFFSAICKTGYLLIYCRVLQGVGGAMIFGTGVAILTSVFPVGERGKVLGINTASVYLGLSIGPFVGGFLVEHFGWRSLFWVNVLLGGVAFIFIIWKLKGEWAEARGERFDFIGSIIYGISLIMLMYGFSQLPSKIGLILILCSVLSGWSFIQWEMKNKVPILNITLFKGNPVFAFSNLAALINYSATSASGFLLSLYLQYIKGLGPQNTGLILIAQPIIMTVFSPFAGKLSDRIEPRILSSIGMGLTCFGLLLFVFLGKETSLGFIIFSLSILGFGFAFFSSPNTNAVMSSVEKKCYGVASATLGTMRIIGQMLSMGVAMLLFAVNMGGIQITPECHLLFLNSMKTAFIIFAVICFCGIFASLARGNIKNKQ
ncbi:MAG: MFS transporter [bacterium]|nr:MFS transporter [bacterium]